MNNEVKKSPSTPQGCKCRSCGYAITSGNAGIWSKIPRGGVIWLCTDCARKEGLIK
jgi:hypothetical protein